MLRLPIRIPLALGAVLALALAVPLPGEVSAQEPSGAPLIYEGPGGRVPLRNWVLQRDPHNRGLHLGYQRGTFGGATVSVPNVVEPKPYAGKAGGANYDGSVAWYRTTFRAETAGVYALGFQSANYLAQVWLDGTPLGSHHGSYLPFEFRRYVAAGVHTVVVRIDWRDPDRQSREGFHRTWFNWGGLDGEATVRPIGASELSQPKIQTTLTQQNPTSGPARVRITVLVHNNGPARTLTPTGSLSRGSEQLPLSFRTLDLQQGQTVSATASVTIANPALWSIAHPSLYDLSLEVPGESSYVAHVGLHQYTWHGGHVYLNGQMLRLHGASVQADAVGHGDALTPSDEDRIVGELEQIHANVVRSQHPLDPGLLERLDSAGILVWQGVGPVEGAGNWYSSTPRLLAEAEGQARMAVRSAMLHPSIFAWNLSDEIAHNGRNDYEVRYVQNTARWLHAYDPTRLVGVDIWGDHPPKGKPGRLYDGIDAIAETDYSGWYDSPRDTPSQLAALMRSRLAAMQRTFPGRVLVISEFGAESNLLNPGGAPGSYSFQARLLAEHISVYAADHSLTAMMIWLLRDYPLNPTFEGGSIRKKLPHLKLIEALSQKGLFTYGGYAKYAVSVVGRMYGALGPG
ncbi:MAG TPA: glycoside hydrolase family 2 TIM barrel-domain containing protein [Solirubrobacteraceae bacterium]|nr:glycoside hydrolase family 2 TIM barrel-domain containing protein [Solirubrobacteraceae bacterium]